MNPSVARPSVWDEWGRVTRFLQSARLAFARESALWRSLEISDPSQVTVERAYDGGVYRVSLDQHRAAVEDEETLLAAVLIQSYALCESAAVDKLQLDSRSLGGIEDWGRKLLAANGRSWSDVLGGRPGVVEAAVVRNVYAHGQRELSDSDARRLVSAGHTSWSSGDAVAITDSDLRLYRDRLRSLMRFGNL